MPKETVIGLVSIVIWVTGAGIDAAEFRRELSTDRPDKTESPYTVEKGRFQFELQPFSLAFRNSDLNDSTKEFVRTGNFGGIAKFGVSNRVDVQLQLMHTGESYWLEYSRRIGGEGWFGDDSLDRQSKFPNVEFGDPLVRVKINLKGNDDGRVSVALMPYVSIPIGAQAATADAWEGGLILPAGFSINERMGAGMMVEFDYVSGYDGDGHHLELITSATTAMDISDVVGMYVEIFQSVDLAGNQPWTPTFDTGFTVAITENMQFDLGVNFGLNRYADDFTPFAGFSFRL